MNRRYLLFMSVLLMIGGEFLCRHFETDSAGDSLFNYFFFDEQFRRQGLIDDGGVFAEGYEVRVNSRGFRDSKEWPPSSKKKQRRIIIAAAGHGYGENITDGLIYAHLLEQSLNELSVQPVELFNVSVQGSTILFLERALLTEIINAEPDVVILSYGGFNEALYTSLPEATVLFPDGNVYNLLMSSALVRQMYKWLVRNRTRSNRVTPVEMIESYQRIVFDLQKNGIAVLLLHQVVIHPDIEGLWSLSEMETYHNELQKFATEQNVLLSDPLPFCPVIDRCFEEKEWYSIEGHQAAFGALQQHSTFLLGTE